MEKKMCYSVNMLLQVIVFQGCCEYLSQYKGLKYKQAIRKTRFFLRYSQIIHRHLATGKIIVISAPSGSGKSTLVKRLLAACPQLDFSISACTRQPRAGERPSTDYHFYTETEFKQLIDDDAFVEWEMVYNGKYYGTLKSEFERIWDGGRSPVVDIDVKGALAIKAKYPEDCVTIFIELPSLEVLRERLLLRGTETAQGLEERVSKAALELTFAPKFDRIVVNENLDEATRELMKIVEEFAGC
jgi:guanylate kinase